jgi:anti-anti-sigma factor
MQFQITFHENIAVLTLFKGFLNDREIHTLREAVRKILLGGKSKLVVDLGSATHMNSMLVGSLVEFYTSYTNAGGWVLFAQCQDHCKVLFRVLKLDRVFEFTESVEEALGRLRARDPSTSAP